MIHFLSQIKSIWKKILVNRVYHTLTFLILFLILLLILYYSTKPLELSYFYSSIVQNLLLNLNIQNELFFNGLNYGLIVFDNEINIVSVCTGLFELCVFVALIFANLKVSFKNKIIGLLFLLILFLYFNLIRILVMIFLLGFANLNLVDVLHTLFFKLGFFVFFVFFYYIWLIYSDRDLNEQI